MDIVVLLTKCWGRYKYGVSSKIQRQDRSSGQRRIQEIDDLVSKGSRCGAPPEEASHSGRKKSVNSL